MTSSMLAGERRWASARRGGMTVLGKVAVPKPLNLPSQKLENHGLDPNVEIVPKGSLSWGSRPSSSTSNPWGASAVSPHSDGNTVSPRHPSNRPTSGGGLSRPSTAGSDRAHEPSANTWGPNSRPSSASGVLTSNQSSLTVSRPLSAETRPGSSHLSRFAEPVYDNSMAWVPNGTSDKLSIPSKGNDFSLSSGDFPTLGSEKDNLSKSSEAHDQDSHVRPGSASGRNKDRIEISQTDPKGGTVDTWTRDGPPHHEEKWQGDPHQYGPPQHYDAWRGPPMNAPGVWYRGPPPPPPPAGPPYPPVPHGGYPMEPFPYYRPQIPPPLANSQPGPPQGPGPRGHHPRNGDFYRPQMPDAFIRPGMPIRPAFYPGPGPYEGYFGPPPMGYNPNPNDRDNPFMGMPPAPHGPPVYNMCPPQNPSEINDPHFRGGGPRGPVGNMFVPEQMDSVPPEEPRGPYKVLRKRDHERNADVDEGSWEQHHTTSVNSSALEKNEQPRPSFNKVDRSTDTRRSEDIPSNRNTHVENPSSRMLGNQNRPSNESWGKKLETVTPVLEVAQDIPVVNPKDPSLIQKIEGLNAKVRASDVASGSVREEQKSNRFVNQKDNSTPLTFGSISNTEDLATSRDINVLRGENTSKSTTGNPALISRQPHHGVRKGSSNNQSNDGWRKKPQILGSDSNPGQVSAENPETKTTGESLTPMVDSSDGQAQRARMRELAKQRAIQLQKEEEERIKEQKAKALAKLEELNRRTLAADGTTQTAEGTATTTTNVSEPENVVVEQKPTGPDTDASKNVVTSSDTLDIKSQPVVQVSKNSQQEPVIKQTVVAENKSATAPLPTQQRKRNNKSSKNKPKAADDTSAGVTEGDVAKVSSEIGKQEAPPLPPPTQVESESSKDAMQSQSNNNQYNNNNNSNNNNKGQQQHSRRMARNPHPQAARSADRFHGNDGVMWAPVRANKEDRGDEQSQQDELGVPAAKRDNSVQSSSSLKSRRAEMERYVPKPVAKELAQQGTTTTTSIIISQQQSASPSSPPRKSDTRRDGEESGGCQQPPPIPVSVTDNRQNKPMKNNQQGVSLKKNNQKPVEVAKAPVVVTSETNNVMHEWDPSDGWFMPEYPPPPTTEVVKDEKGKKPAYNKSQGGRSTVKNTEEAVETERPTSAKENRSSHWQPKPQGSSNNHNKGGWGQGEEHHVGGERKPRGGGGRIHSPNNLEDEGAPFEQQPGFRKYGGGGGGGQNNRGGGGGGGRQHNVNNREKQRQNLHYEYQPVGVGSNSNTGSSNNAAGSAVDGSGNARYKERVGPGSGQSRRGGGNFYGRQ